MPQGASAAPDPGIVPLAERLAPAATGRPATGPDTGWRPRIGRLGGALLGIVLLVATFAKALDPEAFADGLSAQGLTLGLPPLLAALVALAVEGGLGLALLLGSRRPVVLGAAALLVAFFLALNARSWWVAAHGGAVEESCGCFGNLVQRTPAEAFWQDLLLLVPPLLLAFVTRPRRPSSPAGRDPRLFAAALGAAAIALFAWRAPVLPLDDLATRLRPGVHVDELCTGGDDAICLADLAPELRDGRWRVVLIDVERSPEAWADELNRAAESGGEPLLALTASPTEQVTAFTWQWGPSYRLREAPPALLRPLHRRLPRSFISEDGRVVATFEGPPPVGGAASASRVAEQGDRPR